MGSATAATRISIEISLDGVRGHGTGKPDEIERLMSGLGRGRRKSAWWQLADALLYRTSGLMSGDGKRSVAAWPKPPRPSSTLRAPRRRVSPVEEGSIQRVVD